MSTLDILIADDDAVLRNLYIKKFTTDGFTVRIAENGEQAVEEIKKKEPDLLLLDIHMPKMDGFQVMQMYPREKRHFSIIALTNFGDEESRAKGKELGADDYFVKKDMTIKALVEMTQKALANKPQQ